ncbi:MAG: NusA-like transcription termination signal-binding factor [Candidatus Thermoplasmatota archaeon]|nr:NusA-like transcription termination signal-binding factor [Candidatus Thermoplasmatota archaeon]
MDIKFDTSTMQYITLFENLTKARVKDCLGLEEKIVFIVNKGQLGLAIGKNSVNLKKLKFVLKKNIDIIEYSDDVAVFIKNIFHNYKVIDIVIENKNVIVVVEPKDKGKAIGKNGKNLRAAREIAHRHYGIQSMVVR